MNKHPPRHAASGTEINVSDAPIRELSFGHVTAVSLSLSLFVAGRMSLKKGRKRTNEHENQKDWDEKWTTVVLGEMKLGDKERKIGLAAKKREWRLNRT